MAGIANGGSMKNRIATGILTVLGICTALLPGTSFAANIGHYELCNGAGAGYLADAITSGGGTPVNITVPDAAQLAGVSALLVTNCSNSSYNPEWTANLAAIDARVQAGMALVFYDRYVTGAGAQLPGGAGIVAVRDFADDRNIDLPAGSPCSRPMAARRRRPASTTAARPRTVTSRRRRSPVAVPCLRIAPPRVKP